MKIKIALAGNPNCGKTTLFNALTGSNQFVGNWPGVTVEKKEGKLKKHDDVVITDLPGIYSLSPYTLEEVVARNYLIQERPEAILNIIDGTNLERNLYLTTQLTELGIPVVVAVNMMDLVRRNGDQIDARKLSDALGCQVVEISALKGEGGVEAAELAAKMAQQKRAAELPHVFTGSVEHAIAHIEESIQGMVDDRYLRWYAVKVFERDEKVLADLNLSTDLRAHLEDHIVDCEKELDDDAESIITNQRYAYINDLVTKAVKKKGEKHRLSTSDKIDQIVTNRILALPIFAVVMFAVYWIAMGPFGTFLTDWTNDVLGTAWLVEIPRAALEGWGVNEVVVGLICDGALAGEVVHRLAELGDGGGIELGDLDVADGVLHHLVLHAGNDVLAADDGVLRGLGVGRHVAQGHLGAALALQTGEHVLAGEVLHVRAVDGGDEAAHLQAQLFGGAAGVDLGDAGIAGGVLHHVHAHAHDVAALHFQQFGVLFGGVVGGVAVTGAQDIAVADHVEEGGILDVAIVIGAHVFVQLGQLGVHALLLLHRGDGLIEDLPRQDHGHREGHRHGDDGDGKRQADADFFVHGQ